MQEDLVKVLLWDVLVKAALQRLFLLVPLLGWGPIGMVVSHYAFKLTDFMYEQMADYISITIIAARNKKFESEFNKAAINLKLIAMQKGIQSDEYRSAREQHKKALSDFVRFNPART